MAPAALPGRSVKSKQAHLLRTDAHRVKSKQAHLLRTDAHRVKSKQAHLLRTDAHRVKSKQAHLLRTDAHRVKSKQAHLLRTDAHRVALTTLTGALSLFGGACTATSFVLQVSASAASYAASLRLSCPAVPSLTDVAASLSYANGTVSLDVTGSLSFLDGAVAVSQLSLSSTSAAAYVAGSCTGSVAGATGSLQFNLTKPTASVPVPKTSLALTIPNINFGTLASSLWATAAGQSLPSVLTSLTLPVVTIQTPDLSSKLVALVL
eukprot:XP_001700212.1 predicted protein [Chlamydomonas reinhardtii]